MFQRFSETKKRELYYITVNRNQLVIVHYCTCAIESIDLTHGILGSSKSKLFLMLHNVVIPIQNLTQKHTQTHKYFVLKIPLYQLSRHSVSKSSNCFCLCANGFLLYMSKQTNIYYCWSCWACLCLLCNATNGSGITNGVRVCLWESERDVERMRAKIGRHVVLSNDKKVFARIRCTLTVCSFFAQIFHSLARSRSLAPHF